MEKIELNIQKDRYKLFGTYVFDRWIFTTMMLLIFGFLFYVAWSYNFNLDYYNCIKPAQMDVLKGCKNPFYQAPTWKQSEYLYPGEYGTKPGFLFDSIWGVVIGSFILAFGLNHYVHNKGKKLGLLKFLRDE